MTLNCINRINGNMNMSQILLVVFIAQFSLGTSLQAADLPPELPLWEKLPVPAPDAASRPMTQLHLGPD